MKKVLIALLLLTMGFNLKAQDMTREEARHASAKVMVQFKASLSDYYESSDNYNDFKNIVTKNRNINSNGDDLLRKTYDFFEQNVEDETILQEYNGYEIAKVLKDVENGNRPLGGGEDENADEEEDKKCKWYQVRCHLVVVFGEEAAD